MLHSTKISDKTQLWGFSHASLVCEEVTKYLAVLPPAGLKPSSLSQYKELSSFAQKTTGITR